MVFKRFFRYFFLLLCCGFCFLGFVGIFIPQIHAIGNNLQLIRKSPTVMPTATLSPSPTPSPSPTIAPTPTPTPGTHTTNIGGGGANLVLVFTMGGLGVALIVTGIIVFVYYSRRG